MARNTVTEKRSRAAVASGAAGGVDQIVTADGGDERSSNGNGGGGERKTKLKPAETLRRFAPKAHAHSEVHGASRQMDVVPKSAKKTMLFLKS